VAESVLRFRVETADANRKVAKLEEQVRKLEIALKNSGGTSRRAATGMKAFQQGAGAAGVSAKALGVAVKGILGPLSLVATAAGAVVAGFKGFVEADKSRAAVRTLGVDVKTLEGQLVGVVARTGGLASSNELLAASYDVASAGFGKAADITKILEASLLGAVGGMTDIGTVSDAATSVMNAFGLTTDSVSKIVDGFVQTQNDGKIVVGQYASQIGRVAPIAAAAGVGIDELNAAISTVTAQGVPVESTFSGINQVIASIVKPTSEAAKAAKRLGLDFSSAAIKTKGFGGFLEDVIQKTGGSEVEITKLFGSVDALKALMPLINDDLVTFNKNLANQKNATGAAKDAADIMGSTVSSQLSQIVNNVMTLVRALDQILGPAISALLGPINTVLSAATSAVAELTKMLQMNRARTQARKELGGTMGRGTTKGRATRGAVETLATEKVTAANAASAVKAAATSGANQILPTGGGLGGGGKERVDMSEKMLDLSNQLRSAQEGEQQRLAATLKLMIEKQKLSESELLPREKENKLAEATHRFRQEILKIDQQASEQANKDAENRSKALLPLQQEIEMLTAKLQGKGEEKLVEQEILAIKAKAAGLTDDEVKALIEQRNLLREEVKVAEDIDNLYKGIGNSIKSGVTDAIMGAIDGTKTLGEAASGILKNIGNQLISFGLNSIFGGLGGGGGILGSLFGGGRANGGTVQGGRSYVVGEKGPELFTPGRTGSVAPNSSMGGNISVNVNVDASGSAVQGDGNEGAQLGKAIGAAVQQELMKQKRPGGLLAGV
jgi:TP901 family phage tail tape measure protein